MTLTHILTNPNKGLIMPKTSDNKLRKHWEDRELLLPNRLVNCTSFNLEYRDWD